MKLLKQELADSLSTSANLTQPSQ